MRCDWEGVGVAGGGGRTVIGATSADDPMLRVIPLYKEMGNIWYKADAYTRLAHGLTTMKTSL